MTPKQLEEQLHYFKKRDYIALTFAEAERARQNGSLPRRSLVLTFDDGYESMLEARSVLDEFGYVATVFVVTKYVGASEPMAWEGVEEWGGSAHEHEMRSLDWGQLGDLREAGWEVGSHTVSHPDLTTAGTEQLHEELTASREAIVSRLGECDTIAYPYGRANKKVAAEALRTGYLAGCTLTRSLRPDEAMLRPRVGIYPADEGYRFKMKASPLTHRLRRSRLIPAEHQLDEPSKRTHDLRRR